MFGNELGLTAVYGCQVMFWGNSASQLQPVKVSHYRQRSLLSPTRLTSQNKVFLPESNIHFPLTGITNFTPCERKLGKGELFQEKDQPLLN